MLDWNGHANCEFCGLAYTLCYLYKYLYKGPKAKTVELSNRYRQQPDGEPLLNEVTIYIRGRYLCANEAIWRMLGYQSYPSPSPPVITVKVTTESELKLTVNEGNTSHMEMYLRRPKKDENESFSEFWAKYLYDTKLTKYAERNPEKYYEVTLDNRRKYFVYELTDTSDRTLVRIGTVSYTCGEKFYLRLLMLHSIIPCIEEDAFTVDSSVLYDAIKTVDGTKYNTFQEAAVATGIVQNIEVMIEIFEDFVTRSPRNVRLLFINLTVNGYPTKYIFDDDEWIIKMTDDMHTDCRYVVTSLPIIRELLLEQLQKVLQSEYNKELCEFGLPSPKNVSTELNQMRIQYIDSKEKEKFDNLQARFPMTNEQKEYFEEMEKDILEMKDAKDNNVNKEGIIYFVTGNAGCGKTKLIEKVAAFTRSIGGVAVGCAATALAATVYNDNWLTAHSQFAFPVDNEYDENDYDEDGTKKALKSRINESKYKHRRELLLAANVHREKVNTDLRNNSTHSM